MIEDLEKYAPFAQSRYVTGAPNLRFYAGHPIEAPGGERVGALCLMDTKPRELNQQDRQLLKDLALWVQTELAQQQNLITQLSSNVLSTHASYRSPRDSPSGQIRGRPVAYQVTFMMPFCAMVACASPWQMSWAREWVRGSSPLLCAHRCAPYRIARSWRPFRH